ncbi:ABC transporter protein [Lotmaria passim]
MELVQLQQILGQHDARVTKIFVNNISELGLRKIDDCVLEYMLKMLEGQTSAESYLPEEIIEETMKLYFREFDVFNGSEEQLSKCAAAICREMLKEGITKKPSEESSRLTNAVNIGRQYEESMKRATMIKSVGKVTTANTNEDWSWEKNRNTAKDIRKKRKEDEKKAMLAEEYEEFLKKRGIANATAVTKLHHKGEGTNYSTDIRCEGIHIQVGKQLLLDETDLVLLTGHKYGLIGRNGAGKTTLLRALAERELEGVSPYMQILHVEQEIMAGMETPLEVLLQTDAERTQLLKEEQELLKRNDAEANTRLNEVYARLDAIDAHSAEARAAAILHGLSFTQEMMSSPTKLLSGGWRMRVALARALFVEPDVLLLDEPTNHLDLFAVLWLEGFLKDWQKTLVVVSHSRTFLNNVCSEVIHLVGHQLHYYKGNYDQFELTRVEQERQQKKQFASQEKQRAHIQAFIDKFRYNAKRAKMAQSRIKALERMELVADVVTDPQFAFTFPDAEPVSGSFIEIVDCEFGYKPGVSLFKDVNMGIDESSRIVLVGANGAGKSTFMNICMGKLEPRMGTIVRNKKIRIAHFAQHNLESLTPQLSSVEFLRSKFPHMEDQQLRAHLGSMGLSGDRALQPIYTLSGGQKSRLVLAWITFQKPHLLLLDEPTNHLDIDTVNALIEALLAYNGGLLVISHDEYFITSLCDDIYVCEDQTVKKFDGDFPEYRKHVLKMMKA